MASRMTERMAASRGPIYPPVLDSPRLTEDMADSLLWSWGRGAEEVFLHLGYSASSMIPLKGTSATVEELAALAEGLPYEKLTPYYWKPSDIDLCDRVMVCFQQHDHHSARILKGVYLHGWWRGRGHRRSLKNFVRYFNGYIS